MQWLRLYDSVVDDPKVQRLSPPLFKAWINLLCIANRSEPRGLLPPIDDLCFILRTSKPKVAKLLSELQEADLLDVLDDNTLAVHNWNKRQRSSDDISKRVRKYRDDQERNVTDNVSDNVTSRAGNRTDTEAETETEQNTPPKPPKRSPGKAEDPPGFVRFWEEYPKREDRKLAVDQWRKLDPDDELTEQIMAAIAAQKEGRKWKEGFVKAPHRWLRDKNWLDEVEPPRLQLVSTTSYQTKEDKRQKTLDYFMKRAQEAP